MGVRIIGDDETAVMYCSTTDWAFGPVFSDKDEHSAFERIESFLRWLRVDPREFDEVDLSMKYTEWLSQEKTQWMVEAEKETEE